MEELPPMKKLFICTVACLIISFASSSMAKPVAEEFQKQEYDYSSIKTVLVMPVMYEISYPRLNPSLMIRYSKNGKK